MLKVEIADTPHKLEKGLMFRKDLEDDSGMLFKFQSPQILRFWGMNTYIPLDIAFVTPEGKIAKIGVIKPFSLKGVTSETNCHLAVEANLGWFASQGIKVGDTVFIKKTEDGAILKFQKV